MVIMTQKSATLTCPTCGKKLERANTSTDLLPFCSKRCKMIDLGKWLGEKYVVVGDEAASVKKTTEE